MKYGEDNWRGHEEEPGETYDEFDDEGKYCDVCCHFRRSWDDLYQHMGVCAFSDDAEEHDEDMECYFPEKYERCHW